MTHEVFFSQPNSFLAIILQPPTQFKSCALKLISWQADVSKLESVLLNWTVLYDHFTRTTQKTQPVYCLEDAFIAPLHSNGSLMCLLSRCLAMNVYSDFTTPAFGRHVTILCCDHFLLDPFQLIIHPLGYLTNQRFIAFEAEKWSNVPLYVGCSLSRDRIILHRTQGTIITTAKLIPRALRYSCHATGFDFTRTPNCVYLHSKLIK
jgi:hypothetical protein